MVNMSAKFDEEAHNGLVSHLVTSLLPYMSIVTLTSKINRVHLLTMVNISAKFDKDEHNVRSLLCSQVYVHICPL